jgi:hypothetical protein
MCTGNVSVAEAPLQATFDSSSTKYKIAAKYKMASKYKIATKYKMANVISPKIKWLQNTK